MASRFALVYWTLFCVPMLLEIIARLVVGNAAISSIWDPLAVWVGHHVLGITDEIATVFNGSGDRTVDWLGVLCVAGLSAIATVVWSMVDRRTWVPRAREAVRVVIRYTLAFIMLRYGAIKILVLQFPAPSAGHLLQSYGDSSPMGLFWTFMGASPAYVVFAGCAEALGATLLLFRRTTLLGALVLAGVLANVVMINFCYDVPVKLHSARFLAMCVFLMMPDLGRLANVTVWHRPTQPVAHDLVLTNRWMRVARLVVKYGVISLVVLSIARDVVRSHASVQRTAWYTGYWNVTRFVREGEEVPPLITDATRWKRVKFESGRKQDYMRWRFMDDSYGDLYTSTVDDAARTMTLVAAATGETPTTPVATVTVAYTRRDADHLTIEGDVGGKRITVELQRWVPAQTLLATRGFHWINEVPFNQ